MTVFSVILFGGIGVSQEEVKRYISNMRFKHPDMSNTQLAKLVVRRKSFKTGIIGGITGIGGMITLPVTIPANVLATWKISFSMIIAVAEVFGYTSDPTELKTDLYLIIAGDAAKEVLKQAGIKVGEKLTKKALQKYLTRDLFQRVITILGKRIALKSLESTTSKFIKYVPLIGIPIGFSVDYGATRLLGSQAIKYYSKEDSEDEPQENNDTPIENSNNHFNSGNGNKSNNNGCDYNVCIECGSSNISSSPIQVENDTVFSNVVCHDCGARWRDIYDIVDTYMTH